MVYIMKLETFQAKIAPVFGTLILFGLPLISFLHLISHIFEKQEYSDKYIFLIVMLLYGVLNVFTIFFSGMTTNMVLSAIYPFITLQNNIFDILSG